LSPEDDDCPSSIFSAFSDEVVCSVGKKIIPGSVQAVEEKAKRTARKVSIPIARTEELLHNVATLTRKKIVGTMIREYVTNMHGHSGPTKQ